MIEEKLGQPTIVERRAKNKEWETYVTVSIAELKDGHEEIRNALRRNNELTEMIYVIIDNTKSFWNFCTKASRFLMWLATKGTVIAAFIVAGYHAVDAISGHSVSEIFKGFTKK